MITSLEATKISKENKYKQEFEAPNYGYKLLNISLKKVKEASQHGVFRTQVWFGTSDYYKPKSDTEALETMKFVVQELNKLGYDTYSYKLDLTINWGENL